MTEEISRIETALEKSDDELQAALPALLDDLEVSKELVREHPTVFGRVVGRMESMDIAAFVEANPETADQFQELLWTGTEVLVEENPEVREQITDDITVNFEATDCPMTGHLEVDRETQTVSGGAGTLDDPTLEITGEADVLVGLLSGSVDPIPGFMTQQYEMDGPIQKGTRLAPLMSELSETIPN
jgi:putative sterol carrier protein